MTNEDLMQKNKSISKPTDLSGNKVCVLSGVEPTNNSPLPTCPEAELTFNCSGYYTTATSAERGCVYTVTREQLRQS